MLMRNIFKMALLVGSISLACSQSAGALCLGPSVPAMEIAVEYGSEKFNQQVNFQKFATECIDRKDGTLTMVAQRYFIDGSITHDKVPKPRPAPISPRF